MDFIVRETCGEIRALARMALRNNWKKIALGVAVFYVLISTIPGLIDALIPGAVYSYYDPMLEETFDFPIVSILYFALMNSVFSVGMYSYLIFFVRRKEINIAHMFDGFEHVFKAIWLNIVATFFIVLWSLLFVIPGIIAAIRYSQAYVILADHPEYSVSQCMGISKQYMKKNKGKFFCLGLTFIGWALLASIPSAFIPLSLSGVPLLLIELITGIPYFFFLAYMFTAQVIFYELVSKNLVAAPAAEPEEEYNF